jgi:hypothetical protein
MCDWVANVLGSRSEVEAMVVDESKEEVWRRAAPASAAMSVPAQLADVPPYQLQSLVASVNEPGGPFSLTPAGVPNEVRCAQALGAEVNPECSCARADLTRGLRRLGDLCRLLERRAAEVCDRGARADAGMSWMRVVR